MPPHKIRHLDTGSRIVVLVTCGLFIAALFSKGLGHGILLEAGVFLVSVKLIVFAYKNSVTGTQIKEQLSRIESLLEREER
jgi:hypothetical protein